MNRILLFALVAICLVGVKSLEKSYSGYELIEVLTSSDSERSAVLSLGNIDETLDFWSESHESFHIFVPPEKLNFVKRYLDVAGLTHYVINDHVQSDIEEESARLLKKKVFDIDDFNTFEDISAELNNMAARCRSDLGVNCEVYSAGKTSEGRDLWILKMSKNGSGRKGVWLDATIHAREWLATATHLKIMAHLIDDYATDATVRNIVDTYDWYLNPVANPDGYAYTWSNDRLWRKNRSPNTGSVCIGTDLNRNYDQMWGNAGASTSPCSDTYRGSGPASELETKAIQAQALQLGPTLATSVHLHTYAQYWLIPWGSYANGGSGPACNIAEDNADMLRLANPVADAIQNTYGTTWARGNSCQVLYPASGLTMDYFKGVAGVKYTALPELRGNSFVVNKSQIPLSFNEVWNGLVVLFETLPDLPQ